MLKSGWRGVGREAGAGRASNRMSAAKLTGGGHEG